MLLLLNMKVPKSDEMTRAVQKVFKKRDTHPLPKKLDSPPAEWKTQFTDMAAECGLLQDMQTGFEKVSDFYSRIFSS